MTKMLWCEKFRKNFFNINGLNACVCVCMWVRNGHSLIETESNWNIKGQEYEDINIIYVNVEWNEKTKILGISFHSNLTKEMKNSLRFDLKAKSKLNLKMEYEDCETKIKKKINVENYFLWFIDVQTKTKK